MRFSKVYIHEKKNVVLCCADLITVKNSSMNQPNFYGFLFLIGVLILIVVQYVALLIPFVIVLIMVKWKQNLKVDWGYRVISRN